MNNVDLIQARSKAFLNGIPHLQVAAKNRVLVEVRKRIRINEICFLVSQLVCVSRDRLHLSTNNGT
jgi:hypothetical protein